MALSSMGLALIIAALGSSLFMQAGNPIVSPPAPANVTVRNEITVEAPPPDPQAIADASTQSYQSIVVQLIAPTLVHWVDDLLNTPDFIRETPPDLSYNHPAVRGLADQVRLVALVLVALVVIGIGIGVMLGQPLTQSVGRGLFAVALSVADLVWWQLGIDLNNGITAGISAPPIRDLIRPHLTLPAVTSNPVDAFAPAVLVIVYAIVALLLLISLAFRLGLIDILIVVGPLALLCAGTAQTSGLYSRYVNIVVGTVFSQVLIVIALRLAPVLGGIGGAAGTILGIVVLLLARQMPSMMASGGARSGGMSAAMILLLRRAVLRR